MYALEVSLGVVIMVVDFNFGRHKDLVVMVIDFNFGRHKDLSRPCGITFRVDKSSCLP